MQNKSQQIISLIELNEELENYFSNTIIPQLFVDANLVLRKFTPPAMKHFKLKDEFIGRPLEEVEENFRYHSIIDNIQVVIATGKILEKEIQTTDLRWYQMNILPYIVRKESKTNGVIITFIDITSRIRDLKEQESMIAEHELLLDTVAHDLKNPIHGIGMVTELLRRLQEKKNMEKLPVLLHNIENSLESMKKVIGDLMDFRWKEPNKVAAAELIDLESILEDVRLTLAPQIQESQAVITVNLECSEVTFVRRKLRSIVYNLVSNAIKYTRADHHPEITITSVREEDYVVFSVADKGIGMNENECTLIFEKFQRVKSTFEGSGVGLYLVKAMVNAAGGKIELESKPGKGSVFKVFIKMEPSLI
ncbi:ATP-binding protein [Chryseobacterium wangxinyae]|uniref:sensor histidine kinase n=1 Tax=Chryseobacterium sp. CY350 TaxID=2997336 RepID=UPI00226E0C39|nr:ATP-binding protein [Chryseobacterium sp. CY350]MCY0976885.1 ATP-binding protein [Chryseobacterium sp. CY350]WBZ96884.1 ATP-binding protein [Chryseobacterium sp. CY350]